MSLTGNGGQSKAALHTVHRMRYIITFDASLSNTSGVALLHFFARGSCVLGDGKEQSEI
jgi:hypothetical protein